MICYGLESRINKRDTKILKSSVQQFIANMIALHNILLLRVENGQSWCGVLKLNPKSTFFPPINVNEGRTVCQ